MPITSNHLPDDQVFIGDDTAELLMHLDVNEGVSVQTFFKEVVKFYDIFVTKQLKVFDFKSQVLSALACEECEYANLSV